MCLENVVGLLECHQTVCSRVISPSTVCCCGDPSWDVPYYGVNKLRISRLMSCAINKHYTPENGLSEFRDETLLLSSISQTSHSSFGPHAFDEGLQS